MVTATSAASGSAPERHTIGEVLTLLRPDFPEISIPKIRFLEEKGLVKPERTPRGIASSRGTTWSDCATCCGCSATTTCR